MSISMIIPIYNEAQCISALLNNIAPMKDLAEIVFVDGGSTDGTLELIGSNYRVIHAAKGRAKQMNLGSRETKGDILLFLHCDSELPKEALKQMEEVMKQYDVGCFGIAFHSRNIWMKCCQIISNHRIKDRKVMFGDQGIFVKRELFEAIGGFREIPIMEDYQFSLTLKEKGIRIGVAKSRIYTSDRRFKKGQRLRIMWKMNRLRADYRRGVDIEEIAARYKDVR